MEKFSVYQGDLGKLVTVRPNIADPTETISDDWVCKTSVLAEDGTTVIEPRVETNKTDDGLQYVVALSPDDTQSIPVNGKFERCKWVIQLENLTLDPAYRREKHIQVNVKKQGIPDA